MLKVICLIIISLVFLDTVQMLTKAWIEVSVAKSVKIYKLCLGDELRLGDELCLGDEKEETDCQ